MMNLDEFNEVCSAAFRITRTVLGRDVGVWWPNQREGSVFAWAVAMQWAFERDGIGANNQDYVWISTNLGKMRQEKLAVAARYNVPAPDAGWLGEEYRKSGPRRLSIREYMVDFSIWNNDRAQGEHIALTMESECFPAHGVGDSASLQDGYSYDFYKVLLVPSPRRLFVARVNDVHGAHRRDVLLQSLTTLANDAAGLGYLRQGDQLAVVILAASSGQRADSIVAVWDPDRRVFESERIEHGFVNQ
jgi:hypothetical protein